MPDMTERDIEAKARKFALRLLLTARVNGHHGKDAVAEAITIGTLMGFDKYQPHHLRGVRRLHQTWGRVVKRRD